MNRCDLRVHRECGCAPNECVACHVIRLDALNMEREAAIQTDISTAEAIFWRGCIVALAFSVVCCVIVAAGHADQVAKIQLLDNQENTLHVARR